METSRPIVTVGLAVYNGEHYITQAISSVLSERYQNWELLIVDDGSKDGSTAIIKSFADPRIRLLTNTSNQGLVAVRNRILSEANGRYLAWLDQDDLSYPERLTRQVTYLERNSECSVVGSWTENLGPGGRQGRRPSIHRYPTSNDCIRSSMLFLNPIACSSVCMRLSDFRERGLAFRQQYGNCLDFDLWSQASDVLAFANLPRVLAAYHYHSGQTSRGPELQRMHAHTIQIQRELAARTLGISGADFDEHAHVLACISPVDVPDTLALQRIAEWFRAIRIANVTTRAFDPGALDQSLARQWFTASFSLRLEGRSPLRRSKFSIQGARHIGLSLTTIERAITSGIRRRASRGLLDEDAAQ